MISCVCEVAVISGVVCGIISCAVVGSIVVGGGVMMMSGGQEEPPALKVTSARCTQLEVEGGVNTEVNTGLIELTV